MKCYEVYDVNNAFLQTNDNLFYYLQSQINDETTNAELYAILHDGYAEIAVDYIVNRQNKSLSPLMTRLYEHFDEDLSDLNQQIGKIILMKFLFGWNKLADALFADYNPIENYNMRENRETDLTEEISTENSETVTNKYSGFNGDAMKAVSESGTDGSIDTTKTNTGSKAKNELTRSGNIGVTTSQQMIESEYNLRKKNLLDVIYRDIDKVLFIDYYE